MVVSPPSLRVWGSSSTEIGPLFSSSTIPNQSLFSEHPSQTVWYLVPSTVARYLPFSHEKSLPKKREALPPTSNTPKLDIAGPPSSADMLSTSVQSVKFAEPPSRSAPPTPAEFPSNTLVMARSYPATLSIAPPPVALGPVVREEAVLVHFKN